MNPLTRMSIRKQLLVLFAILITPVFLMNWYANERGKDILKNQVTDAYVELIKQNHTLIDRDIDTINKITKTIIQNPLTQDITPDPLASVKELVQKYQDLNEQLVRNSTSVDGAQTILYTLLVPDPDNYYSFAPDLTISTRGVFFVSDPLEMPDWYDKALQKKGKGFLQVIENFGPRNEPTLAYIRAVNDVQRGNTVIGVLVATNINLKIQESLNAVSLPEGDIFFMDMNHNLYAGSDYDIGSNIALPSMQSTNKDRNKALYLIESDKIYVMHTNSIQQHKLAYRIPINSLVRQQNELRSAIQTVSVVYAILCFLVMLYFLRSLIRPLHSMANFLKLYEPGKISPYTSEMNRKDEVGVLISSIYGMTQRLNSLINDKYIMEIKQKEAQLQILYEQINPHMLYNTLESIYWKSSLQGETESAEMIKELSKLMKIGLSRGRDLIPMKEELEHVKAYIGLQQKRYDYDFKVNWDIDEEVLHLFIPKITLQPIVENAILHGVRNMGEDGEIIISSFIKEGRFVICIEDNGFKVINLESVNKRLHTESEEPTSGYGTRNVHRRIQMHFGAEYGLHFSRRVIQGTSVTITMPISTGVS